MMYAEKSEGMICDTRRYLNCTRGIATEGRGRLVGLKRRKLFSRKERVVQIARKLQIDNKMRCGDETMFTSEIYKRDSRRRPLVCSI